MTSHTVQSATAAWARVRILLNNQDIRAATAAAREASALTDWNCLGQPLCWGAGDIYGLNDLPRGWIWFEPEKYQLLVNADALAEFGLTTGLSEFSELVFRLPESCFRAYSSNNWHALDALEDIDRAAADDL